MSDHPPFVVRLEPDAVPGRRIALLGALGVLVVLGSVLVVWLRLPPNPEVPRLAVEQPREVAGVLQTLIVTEDPRRLRSESAQALETWGWVDREHEVVRLPLDRALERAAEEGL